MPELLEPDQPGHVRLHTWLGPSGSQSQSMSESNAQKPKQRAQASSASKDNKSNLVPWIVLKTQLRLKNGSQRKLFVNLVKEREPRLSRHISFWLTLPLEEMGKTGGAVLYMDILPPVTVYTTFPRHEAYLHDILLEMASSFLVRNGIGSIIKDTLTLPKLEHKGPLPADSLWQYLEDGPADNGIDVASSASQPSIIRSASQQPSRAPLIQEVKTTTTTTRSTMQSGLESHGAQKVSDSKSKGEAPRTAAREGFAQTPRQDAQPSAASKDEKSNLAPWIVMKTQLRTKNGLQSKLFVNIVIEREPRRSREEAPWLTLLQEDKDKAGNAVFYMDILPCMHLYDHVSRADHFMHEALLQLASSFLEDRGIGMIVSESFTLPKMLHKGPLPADSQWHSAASSVDSSRDNSISGAAQQQTRPQLIQEVERTPMQTASNITPHHSPRTPQPKTSTHSQPQRNLASEKASQSPKQDTQASVASNNTNSNLLPWLVLQTQLETLDGSRHELFVNIVTERVIRRSKEEVWLTLPQEEKDKGGKKVFYMDILPGAPVTSALSPKDSDQHEHFLAMAWIWLRRRGVGELMREVQNLPNLQHKGPLPADSLWQNFNTVNGSSNAKVSKTPQPSPVSNAAQQQPHPTPTEEPKPKSTSTPVQKMNQEPAPLYTLEVFDPKVFAALQPSQYTYMLKVPLPKIDTRD
ncbi:hypothetical protein BCR37DRAFT_390088 [Protomyces lactucae-debilis]|uniref:Uncharacterized protein n=1 Tax=Protomyces lactucae-debilis TaxID=2754530 RepID=A0A1Y2FU51_PROLT|nr:uncharacterized protein BCR37DRAFT_390088 [Protomyces lactucae-debilis]ORY87540.1 hypothetical protein BCR37DRAFT_390088 [Protomyces lactucae-debilis]